MFTVCIPFRKRRLVVSSDLPNLFVAMRALSDMRQTRALGGDDLYVEARATGARYAAFDARAFRALSVEHAARGAALRDCTAKAIGNARRAREHVRVAAERSSTTRQGTFRRLVLQLASSSS